MIIIFKKASNGSHLYVVLATNLKYSFIDGVVRAERFPSWLHMLHAEDE